MPRKKAEEHDPVGEFPPVETMPSTDPLPPSDTNGNAPNVTEPRKPPYERISYRENGDRVTASIWKGEKIGDDGKWKSWYSVSLSRSYFDETKQQWVESTSFFSNTIPLAVLCLQKAFERIHELKSR